jgi:hypothetical protein
MTVRLFVEASLPRGAKQVFPTCPASKERECFSHASTTLDDRFEVGRFHATATRMMKLSHAEPDTASMVEPIAEDTAPVMGR